MIRKLKEIKLPHVFVLLMFVVFICSLLSYLIPSGEFEREIKQVGNTSRTLVIPDTYQQIPKSYSLQGAILGKEVEDKASPVSLIEFLSAIPRGMEQAADIIFFIFIIIMLVMQFKVLPIAAGLSQGLGSAEFGEYSGGIGSLIGGGGGEAADVEELTKPFVWLLTMQGLFAGLVIGKLSEGKVRAGLKHSFVLVIVSLLIDTGAKLFM